MRTRDEIMEVSAAGIELAGESESNANEIQNGLLIEVLLDIRDLLQKHD